MRASCCAAVIALCALVSTSQATAQTWSGASGSSGTPPGYAWPQYPAFWHAPPGTFPVTFTTDRSPVTFDLERLQDHRVLRCTNACNMVLYPGRYLIRVTPSDRVASGKREVEVDRPMQVRIHPDPPGQRALGLTAGILGILLMLTSGAILIADGSCERDDCPSSGPNKTVPAGFFLVGVGVTVGGFVMFGQSSKPELTVRSW